MRGVTRNRRIGCGNCGKRRIRRAVVDTEADYELEHTAFALAAFCADSAVHSLDEAFCDSHSEPRAGYRVYGRCLGAREWLEYVAEKLLVHADSVVCNSEAEACVGAIFAFELLDIELYSAAVRGIFYRIGQDIYQHASEHQLIGEQMGMPQIFGGDTQLLTAFLRLRTDHRLYLIDLIAQIHRIYVRAELAVFELCHIKQVGDKSEHMAAGGLYLVRVIEDALRRIGIVLKQVGETDDGIHRSSYVMADIRKEVALGAVCVFCCMHCALGSFLCL